MSKNKGKQADPVPEPVKSEPEFTTGNGEFIFPDNSKYNGDWKESNGKRVREGQGSFTCGKEQYIGSWVDDKMNGTGEYTFSSGAVYKGNFVNNAFSGEGEYVFHDGARYGGSWLNNKMHGFGTYVDRDNNVFKGQYINGMYDSGNTYISVRTIQ
jgi:hypothetical protein